jgi:hypothetical protein
MFLLALLLVGAPPVEVQRPHEDEVPNLALSWSTGGAAACPERQQVIEAIADSGLREQLGTWVPSQHAQALLVVEVELTVERDVWRADMILIDADGRAHRQFEARSCQALADATALIIAVTLDPIAAATALAAEAAAAQTLEPAPLPEPVPDPVPAPTPILEPPLEPDDDTTTLGVSWSDAGDDEPAARTNVWTVEITATEFVYQLTREGTDRRFRVVFDLTKPVAVPPAPWGAAP